MSTNFATHTHTHAHARPLSRPMDPRTLLRKMRSLVEMAEQMLAAAGACMQRWSLAWGHTKRHPVSVSRTRRLINVSRHFLPLVPVEDFRQLLGYHIFQVSGKITTWPFDTDCAKRVSEQYVVAKTVVHQCKCGLLTKKAHAIDTAFIDTLCPQCNWNPAVFRQTATPPAWRPLFTPA